MLTELQTKFASHYDHLYQGNKLQSISHERNAFALQSALDAQRLSAWAAKHLGGPSRLTEEVKSPFKDENLHPLPCEAPECIVDEALPASALAYALR